MPFPSSSSFSPFGEGLKPLVQSGDKSPHSKTSPTNPKTPWPHAPVHWTHEAGIYMVTAGTYQKQHFLNTPEKLDFFQNSLFELSEKFHWQLQAWAILSNHYHFIASSSATPENLGQFLKNLHGRTASHFNHLDSAPSRKIWQQFWDSHITLEKSHLARLHYTHTNPAKHGICADSETYPWCSAAWFAREAPPAFAATVANFKTDRLSVPDDF